MLHNVRNLFSSWNSLCFPFPPLSDYSNLAGEKRSKKKRASKQAQAQEATQEYQSIIEKDSVHRSDPYLIDPCALVNQQLLPSRALISPILQWPSFVNKFMSPAASKYVKYRNFVEFRILNLPTAYFKLGAVSAVSPLLKCVFHIYFLMRIM